MNYVELCIFFLLVIIVVIGIQIEEKALISYFLRTFVVRDHKGVAMDVLDKHVGNSKHLYC